MSEITPEKLGQRLQANEDDLLVLDIRHEEDFDGWHIPDSTNLDVYDELTDNLDAAENVLADLSDEKEIVSQESVPADEVRELELGPNNCAAE
ncbi:rhodanese-like domain-containing protein (plasmid) [Haladaptatus sp. SPP-AMP-3]|uniref:rhodanese-like domain-containing protein n=1 Tax=Haladaptatus sp. SPP-AMP-3 TaxID=3121295 RepID=UPI003C2AF26D